MMSQDLSPGKTFSTTVTNWIMRWCFSQLFTAKRFEQWQTVPPLKIVNRPGYVMMFQATFHGEAFRTIATVPPLTTMNPLAYEMMLQAVIYGKASWTKGKRYRPLQSWTAWIMRWCFRQLFTAKRLEQIANGTSPYNHGQVPNYGMLSS